MRVAFNGTGGWIVYLLKNEKVTERDREREREREREKEVTGCLHLEIVAYGFSLPRKEVKMSTCTQTSAVGYLTIHYN